MTRKIIQCLLIALLLLSLTAPIFASLDPNGTTVITGEPQDRQITPTTAPFEPINESLVIGKEEAIKIAAPYQNNDNVNAFGLYTYKNTPYYLMEFSQKNDSKKITGVLVIEAVSGKIATDDETIEKIVIAHSVTYVVSSAYLGKLDNASVRYEKYSALMKEDIKIAEESVASIGQQSNFSSIIETSRKVENFSLVLKENTDQKNVIAKKINAGELSYENAAALRALDVQYISLLEDYLELRKEYRAQSVRYYDLGDQLGFVGWSADKNRYIAGIDSETKNIEDELKVEKENKAMMDGYIAFATNSTDSPNPAPIKETPGFTFLIAVCALFMIGFFIQKQKK